MPIRPVSAAETATGVTGTADPDTAAGGGATETSTSGASMTAASMTAASDGEDTSTGGPITTDPITSGPMTGEPQTSTGGEETTGGRDKASILADTVEALLGAVYLDRGLDEADALIHRLFDGMIDAASRLGAGLDWKTSLQEIASKHGLGSPEYSVVEEGPEFRPVEVEQVDARRGRVREVVELDHAAAAARARDLVRDLLAKCKLLIHIRIQVARDVVLLGDARDDALVAVCQRGDAAFQQLMRQRADALVHGVSPVITGDHLSMGIRLSTSSKAMEMLKMRSALEFCRKRRMPTPKAAQTCVGGAPATSMMRLR